MLFRSRRKTSRFWDIWPLPPLIETPREVVYVDGIYLGRKACILICCDKEHVLGWYLCRYEHARAWNTLFSRIAEPSVVVSDGGTGFAKALKKSWPNARHQRCVFHIFSQVKRYTTSKPKTAAGARARWAASPSGFLNQPFIPSGRPFLKKAGHFKLCQLS